jgi:hypothetical protein
VDRWKLAREAGAAHECVAWAADGRSLATGGADGIVRLFDLEDPQYQRSRRRMDAGPSTTAVGSARGAPHPLQVVPAKPRRPKTPPHVPPASMPQRHVIVRRLGGAGAAAAWALEGGSLLGIFAGRLQAPRQWLP